MHAFLCRFGWHKVDGAGVWNQGYHFGKCSICEKQLIRRRLTGAWRLPRKGNAVVWRPMSVKQREFREAVGLSKPRLPEGTRVGQTFPGG